MNEATYVQHVYILIHMCLCRDAYHHGQGSSSYSPILISYIFIHIHTIQYNTLHTYRYPPHSPSHTSESSSAWSSATSHAYIHTIQSIQYTHPDIRRAHQATLPLYIFIHIHAYIHTYIHTQISAALTKPHFRIFLCIVLGYFTYLFVSNIIIFDTQLAVRGDTFRFTAFQDRSGARSVVPGIHTFGLMMSGCKIDALEGVYVTDNETLTMYVPKSVRVNGWYLVTSSNTSTAHDAVSFFVEASDSGGKNADNINSIQSTTAGMDRMADVLSRNTSQAEASQDRKWQVIGASTWSMYWGSFWVFHKQPYMTSQERLAEHEFDLRPPWELVQYAFSLSICAMSGLAWVLALAISNHSQYGTSAISVSVTVCGLSMLIGASSSLSKGRWKDAFEIFLSSFINIFFGISFGLKARHANLLVLLIGASTLATSVIGACVVWEDFCCCFSRFPWPVRCALRLHCLTRSAGAIRCGPLRDSSLWTR
jgi:hypothetical protein